MELGALPSSGNLWVGYSGGLDSSVLLHALCARPELRARVKALHVHHGLSPKADDWLAHCQAQCLALAVPFFYERVQLAHQPNGLEQAARQARYEVYRRHCLSGDTLLLAHHGDDQIETFFMRMLRGAGLQGAAAMAQERELKNGVRLLRPLLHVLREELEAYAQAHELVWVEDESNQDSRYARNFWRNAVLPLVWQRFAGQKTALLRSIYQLGEDQALLTELLTPEFEAVRQLCPWPNCAPSLLSLTALRAYPASHWPYLVRLWLQELGLHQPSAQWFVELRRMIDAQADATPCLHLGAWQLHRHQGQLFLVQPAALMVQSIELTQAQWPWGQGRILATPSTAGLKAGRYELWPAGKVRGLKLKARFRPRKTLSAWLQEAGIPAALRENWPVFLADGELCAILNVAIAEAYWLETVTELQQTGHCLTYKN